MHDFECPACYKWYECSGYGDEVDIESCGDGDGGLYHNFEYRRIIHGDRETECYREEWCGASWMGSRRDLDRDPRNFGNLTFLINECSIPRPWAL